MKAKKWSGTCCTGLRGMSWPKKRKKKTMNELNYYVYCHINKLNGKVYVGRTDNPSRRWTNGAGYKHNQGFYNDIQEYGWDNFEHRILEDCLTYDESREMERFYIDVLDAKNPEQGYNLL